MTQQVPNELRQEVARIVRWPQIFELGHMIGIEKRFESVLPDVVYFRYQSRALKENSLSQYAAIFKDGTPHGSFVPGLIQVPDLHNRTTSYDFVLKELQRSDLQVEKVTAEDAEGLFIERLSEFLAVHFASASTPSALTIVNSNRSGDTVLCAN